MATNAALATLDHVWGVLEPMGHSLALMGGLSLAAWNYIRATRDVDLLIDDDDVVGNYVTSDGVRHGFIRSQGSYTQLDAPGADGITVAQGINEAGDVAGLFFDANGTSHGFVYNGSYTVIDVLGSTWTEVYDIDAAGRLAGYYEDANGQGHGFVATPVPEPGIGTVMLGLTGFFWYRRNRRGVTKKP